MEENVKIVNPSWLNHGFLKMILSTEDCSIDIVSSKIESVSEASELFDIYRVFVELLRKGSKETISLIAKRTEENSRVNNTEKSLIREVNIYALTIPRIQKILEKLNQQFAPKLYYSQNGPCVFLVHEDLNYSDFRHTMPSGLDMKTCILVTRKLANFHAASVVIHLTHPEVMASFRVSTYSEHSRDRLEKIFPPVLKKLAKEVESWPDYKDRFAVKLHNLANSAVDKICECVKTVETDFNVLCHEELSLRNITFRYSENALEVQDLRFLDYSAVHWGSPAIDFYRFLHSCATPEVLEWSQILVEEYYSVLEDTLNRLGYPQLCPSIGHFYRQLEKRVMFGLILGLVERAIFLSDNCISYSDKDSNCSEIEFSESYKDVVKKILLVFQIKGWL